MKKSRFSESQIISIFNQQEQGMKVHDICREHDISDATFYNWKAKYGGLSPVHHALKDAIEKKL